MNGMEFKTKISDAEQVELIFSGLSEQKQQRVFGFVQGLAALAQFEKNSKDLPDEKIYEKEQ